VNEDTAGETRDEAEIVLAASSRGRSHFRNAPGSELWCRRRQVNRSDACDMVRTLVRVLVVLVMAVVGAFVGGWIGDVTCHEDEETVGFLEIPCLQETWNGLLGGFGVGLIVGLSVVLFIPRRDSTRLADDSIPVRLTVVGSQPEADMICSLLRVHGIECGERAADAAVYGTGGFGGWREILVSRDDLEVARELLATKLPGE